MSNQTSGPSDEREWATRRALLQAILVYLAHHGPTSWVTLYLHFDTDGTGEIGPALGYLAVNKHIVFEGTTATITASGTEQLRSWQS
jgi:hypothetical protein